VPLATHHIEGHAAGPHLLITGGVHGDEFEPMVAIRSLIARLRSDELRGRVTLVPVVNEAAFRRGQRTAEDGLDLARTCPGRPDGSVTERVAFELSALIRTADFYIDLHTGGVRLKVSPLVGYMLHQNAAVLETQRRMARAFGLPIIWGTDPGLDGRSLSVARDAHVPAIYGEYLGGDEVDPAGGEAYVGGCTNVMRELGLLPGPSWPPRTPPLVVEDSRPNSGHMQVNHPSPCDGFFASDVKLGQRVQAGERIGTVCDVLGQRVEPIHARYAGLVIVLHTFHRIDAGSSVAVILETGANQPPP
jgi:predicted deacylase